MSRPTPDRQRVEGLLNESARIYLALERSLVNNVFATRDLLDPEQQEEYLKIVGRLRVPGPGAGIGNPGGKGRRRPGPHGAAAAEADAAGDGWRTGEEGRADRRGGSSHPCRLERPALRGLTLGSSPRSGEGGNTFGGLSGFDSRGPSLSLWGGTQVEASEGSRPRATEPCTPITSPASPPSPPAPPSPWPGSAAARPPAAAGPPPGRSPGPAPLPGPADRGPASRSRRPWCAARR